jgi:hypothetical protein
MRLTNPSKGRYEAEFTAPTSGQVYFFVNDVLVPHWAQFLLGLLPNWMSHGLGHPDAVYFNNHGSAQVEITEVHPAQ